MSRARITIREYIVRRTNLGRGVVVVWMIVMMTVAGMYPSYWHGRNARGGWWFFASFATVLAVLGLIQWRTRCPRCGSRFHRETYFAQRSKFWRATYDRCPRCGVSIDEPMDCPTNRR
jgi:hypothetical protein